VTALLAAPMLLSALAAGLVIGMFQAATQINEMTLSFIPKLLVLAGAEHSPSVAHPRLGNCRGDQLCAPRDFSSFACASRYDSVCVTDDCTGGLRSGHGVRDGSCVRGVSPSQRGRSGVAGRLAPASISGAKRPSTPCEWLICVHLSAA
jgi:hypothetical protein